MTVLRIGVRWSNALIGMVIVLILGCSVQAWLLSSTQCHIAYVDTPKLLSETSIAKAVDKQLDSAQNSYNSHVKAMEDSVNAQIKLMSIKYNIVTNNEKILMKQRLAIWNENLNKVRNTGFDQLSKYRQDKLQEIANKVNPYIQEYGKKHGYDIILGSTSNGSILYGSKSKCDITNIIIKGLNARFN